MVVQQHPYSNLQANKNCDMLQNDFLEIKDSTELIKSFIYKVLRF